MHYQIFFLITEHRNALTNLLQLSMAMGGVQGRSMANVICLVAMESGVMSGVDGGDNLQLLQFYINCRFGIS